MQNNNQTHPSISYLLWCGCFFGFAGLHRLYNGKLVTGVLWFFTLGFFGIGQFIDLMLIPDMVEEHNLKVRARLGLSSQGTPIYQPTITLNLPLTREQLMLKLLRAASARGGKLSASQAVMDTETSFKEVEAALKEMVKNGYVIVDNHPETGVVIYDFVELSSR
jgi:hypothetical protein